MTQETSAVTALAIPDPSTDARRLLEHLLSPLRDTAARSSSKSASRLNR